MATDQKLINPWQLNRYFKVLPVMAFLSFILIWQQTNGQQVREISPFFISYTVHNGLPTNNITYLFNDSKGRMWIGTEEGLATYDGRSFQLYEQNEQLKRSFITCINEDAQGVIWVTTSDMAIFRIDELKITAHPLNDTIKSLFEPYLLKQIGFDDQGNIIGYSIRTEKRTIYEIGWDSVKVLSLWKSPFRAVFQRVGNEVFGSVESTSIAGMVKFILPDSSFIYLDTVDHLRKNPYSYSACRGERFAVTIGLDILIYQHDSLYSVRLPSLPTNSLQFEQNGALWVGTKSRGAFKIENGAIVQNVFPNEKVHSICQDFEDGLWFGMATSGIRYVPNTEMQVYVDHIPNQHLKYLLTHNGRLIWITAEGDVYKEHRLMKSNIFKDGVAEYNNAEYLDDSSFCLVYLDTNGSNQLYCIDLDDYSSSRLDLGIYGAKRLLITPDDTFLLGFRRVNTIDNRTILQEHLMPYRCGDIIKYGGFYWLACEKGIIRASFRDTGHGFFDFDKVIGDSISIIRLIGVADQLIAISNDGRFYEVDDLNSKLVPLVSVGHQQVEYYKVIGQRVLLGLRSGIGILELTDTTEPQITFKQVLLEMGFFGSSIKDIEVLRDTVFISTGLQIISLPLSYINRDHAPVSKLSINAYKRGQQWSRDLSHALNFHSDENLAFAITAVNFREPLTFNYLFRLLPSDTSWHESHQRELTFFQLPANEYKLEVKIKTGEIISLPFVVSDHWYHATWFIILMAIVLTIVLLLPLYFRNRLRIVASSTEREKNNLRMKTLTTQLKPHFVFNALNSIQSYILEQDTKMSATFLAKLARHIRATLEQSRDDMIPLSSSLDSIETYLSLEKMRTRNAFDYQIEVDKGLNTSTIKVPPLLIQPYIENCIVHGFARKKSGGMLNVKVESMHDNRIRISIKDNGIGLGGLPVHDKINASGHKKSLGTKINAERIETLNKLYNNRFAVSIRNAQETGVIVEIIIPLDHEE